MKLTLALIALCIFCAVSACPEGDAECEEKQKKLAEGVKKVLDEMEKEMEKEGKEGKDGYGKEGDHDGKGDKGGHGDKGDKGGYGDKGDKGGHGGKGGPMGLEKGMYGGSASVSAGFVTISLAALVSLLKQLL